MKIQLKLLVIIAAGAFLLHACNPKINYIRPKGNIVELNTQFDELAPAQKPIGPKDCSSCGIEFGMQIQSPNHGIKLSKDWLQQLLTIKYGIYPEAISFTGENSGFFAISHPPDLSSADKLALNISGLTGGTDIFEFYYESGRLILRNLDHPLNSIFWDSHPAAAMDDNCNVVLIWASDRNDAGGFSSPFKSIVDLSRQSELNEYRGNTDLFFSFRINGKWSKVKNLTGINSENNEETPFIYCMCNNPTLLFASNRNGNYDIYYSKLSIDFDNQSIAVVNQPIPVPGEDINSASKEFFPVVASPLSESGLGNMLYLSSNRNMNPTKIDKKTVLQNFGGFDIYGFELPDALKCETPKINYVLRLIDSTNANAEVLSPYFAKAENDGRYVEGSSKMILKPGVKYAFKAGSLYDKIECFEGLSKTISHYGVRKITQIEPLVIRKDSTIEYTEINYRVVSKKTDTVRSTITIHKDELLQLPQKKGRKIENITVQGDMMTVNFIELTEHETTEMVEETKSRKFTVENIIPRWDTAYTKTTRDYLPLSEKTKRDGGIFFDKIKEDITVIDTVYVWPQYYVYPPCEWKYEKDEIEYSKNVPYFQTCFWEVNTGENFNRHINLIRSARYADASFIELHSRNQYFGYRREDLNESQKQFRKLKNDNRTAKYRQYATAVDRNLAQMANEIGNDILPFFRQYDEHAGGTQNKLVITINAYSDIRPIERGFYLGEQTVNYVSAAYDSINNKIINVNPISIAPMASLEDPLNDYLSKLRAYFGYQEIFKRLKMNDNFKYYFDNGWVLMPDALGSKAEFDKAFDKAKIIFLVEGRKVDSQVQAAKMGYIGEKGDYTTYDPVRRVDVIVKRLEWVGGQLKRPDCCQPLK